MIETRIIEYLNRTLNVPASAEIPADCTSFVVVEKVGGSGANVRSATVAIQSYAETLYGAAALNESVIQAMSEIDSLTDITQCVLNTDYNFTDQTKKQYRYQAIFHITYY